MAKKAWSWKFFFQSNTMQPIKVSLIEDEPQSLAFLRNLVQSFGSPYTLVSETGNVSDSVLELRKWQPDILISDIQIHDGTIFDVLEKAGDNLKCLVLLTAYEHYAIRAIKYSAIDYLLKPVNPEELREAMDKCVRQLESLHLHPVSQIHFLRAQAGQNHAHAQGDILVNSDQTIHRIRQDKLLYCKADRNYTEFHLDGEKMVVSSRTLLFYDHLLDPTLFFRIHLSFIVNAAFVEKFIKGRTGYVVMKNGDEIDVASRRMKLFSSFLKKR
jgi:two-component system LytT family response regulator